MIRFGYFIIGVLLGFLFIVGGLRAEPSQDFVPPGHRYEQQVPPVVITPEPTVITVTGDTGDNASSATAATTASSGASATNNSYYSGKGTYDKYVAAAIAPPLSATGDCMGSASGGFSNSALGLALGKTYIDEDCNARRDAIMLLDMSHQFADSTVNAELGRAAIMRLCSREGIAKALALCPDEDPESVEEGRWWAE